MVCTGLAVRSGLIFSTLLLVAACRGEPEQPRLRVAAASSLTEVFTALAESFERAHPEVKVELSFAGSQVLRVQIEAGAPYQVFASAHLDHIAALEADELVVAARPLARNQLVLAVPRGNPARLASMRDLPRVERLVVGSPAVPVGRYARLALTEASAAWGAAFAAEVESKIVSEESNARQVRAKLELGEADAAFIYRTDAQASKLVEIVPLGPGFDIEAEYRVGRSPRAGPWAEAWLELSTGPRGRELLEAPRLRGAPVSFRRGRAWLVFPGWILLGLLVIPLAALVFGSDLASLRAGLTSPLFAPALALSARTTVVSTALVVVLGTPLGWWLATASPRRARPVEALVDLPIVLPPAVLGVALLEAFGRQGWLGPGLAAIGIEIPFTTSAVVIAQVVVSSPFYVQSAAVAFRSVDVDLLIVARTLGASPAGAFARVAVPMALPGLVAGAALSWARAVGEFGATLLFAGSREGVTRTMPLAIFYAFESDLRVAVALALVLAAVSVVLLFALRYLPGAERRRGAGERWRRRS